MKLPEVNYWITNMLESYERVSDLNFTVGKPLQVETAGQLVPITVSPEIKELTPFQTEVTALNLIQGTKRLLDDLSVHGSCDLSHALGNRARFRVNIFTQQSHLSIVMRKMESSIPTINSLNLPEAFNNMTKEINGFILVTGATGSGKSTTLAALCDKINKERMVHVVTLEDPIEFVHSHKKCTFNQRELGNDFDTFANGLRAALRQAPKVILVGEMRDRETMEIGLSAAETGHLVMSTLHTVDSGQTINRILGFFDQEEQPQIRNRLIDTIRYVICQRLLPKEGGDRVAAFEIMANNLRVRDLILNGETEDRTFYDVIEDGSALGMQTFDQHILELYEHGLIREETAKIYASRKSAIGRGLDKVKAARGESTSGITGLSMKKKETTR
jgi:twitching motility protein PilT